AVCGSEEEVRLHDRGCCRWISWGDSPLLFLSCCREKSMAAENCDVACQQFGLACSWGFSRQRAVECFLGDGFSRRLYNVFNNGAGCGKGFGRREDWKCGAVRRCQLNMRHCFVQHCLLASSIKEMARNFACGPFLIGG